MDAMPPIEEPVLDEGPKGRPRTEGRARRIIKTLADWLELLSGPPSPVFTQIVRDNDLARLLKLLILSLSFSGVALGVNFGLAGILTHPTDILLTSKPVIFALLCGVLLATTYSFIAAFFRIKIKLQETFFVILLLCLPWLPLLIFADTLRYLPSFPLIWMVTLLAPLIVLLKAMISFVKGVSEVSECPKWRAWLSVIIPLLAASVLIVLMYGFT